MFLRGLKPAILLETDLLNPIVLVPIMDMEKQIQTLFHALKAPSSSTSKHTTYGNDTNTVGAKQFAYPFTISSTHVDCRKGTTSTGDSTPFISRSPTDSADSPTMLMTHAKFQARKEKGISFQFDEKFGPGHKCMMKHNIIMVNDREKNAEYEVEAGWAPVGNKTVQRYDVYPQKMSSELHSGS